MLQIFASTVLNLLFPPSCRHCGRDGVWLCASCLQTAPVILRQPTADVDRLLALGRYDEPVLQRVIQDIKYVGGRVLIPIVAARLAAVFSHDLATGVLIPVPLHRSRERQRGFNQSRLLARELSRLLGYPLLEAVAKTRPTAPQATLTEAQRLRNLQNSFALSPKVAKMPKHGIVVDDVFTTGATISTVSRVLRSAGMDEVTALTIAKS